MSGATATPPASVAVRMYQVGFGDCFLVSFTYARAIDNRTQRHMLIDFGSTHRPKGARTDGASSTSKAAQLIAEHVDELDVIVVTHRHRDHLSGFADNVARPIITQLAPKLIVRPWTDDPSLPHDASTPLPDADGDPDAHETVRLAAGQRLAEHVESLVRHSGALAASDDGDDRRGRLARLALNQLANKPAIDFLDALAKQTGGGEYLKAGDPTAIEKQIPGIKVRVLGPPTHRQLPDVLNQRAEDPSEFWITQLHALHELEPSMLSSAGLATSLAVPPGPVGWLVDRLADQQVRSLQRIVRTVDAALNNTSLILLIDAGEQRMLFPGDAQIENWSWSLQHADEAASYRRLLAGTDLYKVGHHGSRNATPKSLFGLWDSPAQRTRPMTALLSTMPDVHGRSDATAVPRGALVEALRRRMGMNFVRTDNLDAGFVCVSAPCDGRAHFSVQRATP